jgi:cell division protein FtsI/penicillin-binding protein 2
MSLQPRLQNLWKRFRVYVRLAQPGVQQRDSVWKARVLLLGLLLGYGSLGYRLHKLQIQQHAEWQQTAERQHTRLREIKPERGSILLQDQGRSVPAAMSLLRGSLMIEGRQGRDVPEFLAKVDRALGLDDAERTALSRKLEAGSAFYFRRRGLTLEELEALRAERLSHVTFEVEPVRAHPYGPLAAQIVGLVSIQGDGTMGLESRFDTVLQGEAGVREVQLDSRRRELVSLGAKHVPAQPGHDLVLTLDRSIQAIVASELAATVDYFKPEGAAAVVVDPRTGSILGMASLPDFDPGNLTGNFHDGLRNRCITDTYEPGSTMKPLLTGVAWELGLGHPQRSISCPEVFKVPGRRKPIRDSHHVGTVTEADVIVQSSNVGSYKIASRLSPQQLRDVISGFGLGRRTGVELPGEAKGNAYQVTHQKITCHTVVAVAQGYSVAVTPLQMALAYGALANGGVLYAPRLVAEVRERDGTVVERRDPQPVARLLSGGDSWQALREAMVRVVNDRTGTAKRAKSKTWRVAGKTGTTKFLVNGAYHDKKVVASFCGFAPAEDPRIAFCVVAWNPVHPEGRRVWGGTVAAPCAGRIAEQVLHLMEVPPSPDMSAKK